MRTPNSRQFLLPFRHKGMLLGKLYTSRKSLMRSSAKIGCYQFPRQLMRSSHLKVRKPEQTADTNTFVEPLRWVVFSPRVPDHPACSLPPDSLQSHPSLEGCYSTFPYTAPAIVLHRRKTFLPSKAQWLLLSGNATAPAPARLRKQICVQLAQTSQSRHGTVSAWQSYLPLNTLTYKAIWGQPVLSPKGLHLSPEGLPHVRKICCGLPGKEWRLEPAVAG